MREIYVLQFSDHQFYEEMSEEEMHYSHCTYRTTFMLNEATIFTTIDEAYKIQDYIKKRDGYQPKIIVFKEV